MNNSNFQIGNNNRNNQSVAEGKPDSAWKLVWTAVIAGLVVVALVGLWNWIF